ncbi:PadR family transcriptional regulator [Cryobacterium aureum]|uniref:PadR family transcriptional regulator n=1 Tax=Cryobacterium aureum TaxID=995037 RepID=UPI000CF4F86F|nr:helix-turn-helix transcriptional regulator [Cryobacterium aureum]
MVPLSRVTSATVDVLNALLSGEAPIWGLRVVKQTGRPAGSVYPILERLEGSGWVTSEWEDDSERTGPRRRLYELTSDGTSAAREVVAAVATRSQARVARVVVAPNAIATGTVA